MRSGAILGVFAIQCLQPLVGFAQGSGNREVYNVKAYGALGDCVADDTVPIDQALAAAIANNGGVVYFPQGCYRYATGSGLAVTSPYDPATPITIQGDGQWMSRIVVTSISNPEFIKLKSLAPMGNQSNWGMGVRDLSLDIPLTKDAITIESLESAVVQNVNIYHSKNGSCRPSGGKARPSPSGVSTLRDLPCRNFRQVFPSIHPTELDGSAS